MYITMTEVRLALACVLLLAAALGSSADLLAPAYPCFVGPAAAAGSKTRTESASAASQGVQPSSHQQQQQEQQRHRRRGGGGSSSSSTASSGASPLAKRMLLRRGLARPKPRAGSGARTVDPSPKVAADVDTLFRLEVAQRMKEIKLMTQPGVGPLAPVAAGTAADLAADSTLSLSLSLSPPLLLPSNKKLELESATALEQQISLLSSRISSIADHLQTTPTDAVSRKGLVVLVKRRRRLLETLRHRDQDRWLATTETLGLRQRRPDAPSSAGGEGEQQLTMAARRQRRRGRGRRRRRDEK